MLFNCPLSIEKAEQIINILDLDLHSKVVDIGCGEGEFLTRIYKSSDAHCYGIDLNGKSLEIAREKAEKLDGGKKLKYTESDITKSELANNSFDLAVCISSTHAFGMGDTAYPNALKAMKELVKPDGQILVGEGYWKREPDREYLKFIGDSAGIYNNFEENISLAESFGLVPLYAAESNIDEWDHFEWSFLIKAEKRARENSADKSLIEKLEHVRKWNRFYRKYGRTTMGFGYYLFRV